MFTKIKSHWNKLKLGIIVAAIALAYLSGKRKGKANEKISQTKAILANVQSANRARARLADPVVAKRVREKYTRE